MVEPLRVLAAEDTENLRILLERYLAKAGCRATIAADGDEAARLFEAGEFDLVILDLQMPVLDGKAAARRIRETEARLGRPRTRLLALSANSAPETLAACREAGFDAHVTKPFSKETLLAALAGAPGVSVDPEIADLVPAFLEQRRADAKAMDAALGRGELRPVAETAHRLVGAGGSYGFPALSELAQVLEDAAKRGDAAGAKAALAKVSAYLRDVRVR